MTSQRWQDLDRLFHSALERPPEERAGFLAEACGTDEAVRREVEALIAAHDRAANFSTPQLLKFQVRSLIGQVR